MNFATKRVWLRSGQQAETASDFDPLSRHKFGRSKRRRSESIFDHGFDSAVYPQQPAIGFSPLQSVTLHFTELVYTYQPILLNCQKNGPSVTYMWTFQQPAL